jgi:hypothetical protein
MPAICGAKNRRGKPCQKAPVKGKKRCRNHGGASTGPRTEDGKMRAATNSTTHGAYTTLGAYERILASVYPQLYLEAPSDTSLERELRFARAKLARLIENGAPESVVKDLVTEIRLLATAQHELRPGGDASGSFEVTIRVEGAEPAPEGPAEAAPVEGPCSS